VSPARAARCSGSSCRCVWTPDGYEAARVADIARWLNSFTLLTIALPGLVVALTPEGEDAARPLGQ